MSTVNAAAIMAEHAFYGEPNKIECVSPDHAERTSWPCYAYELAKELVRVSNERDQYWKSYLARTDEVQQATEAYLYLKDQRG